MLAPRYAEWKPSPQHEDEVDRLRSIDSRTVIAFQAIELPRTPADPPEGALRAALGLHNHDSWWERASAYLDRKIERADRNHELGSDLWDEVFTSW